MDLWLEKLCRGLLMALLVWPACSAQATASQALKQSSSPPAGPHIQLESYTLPNGLRVILAPNHRVPKVHVNLWYHVGSKDEPQNRSGFAHLFEHMMFEGSKDAPGNYGKLIEAVGGTINGTTSEDRTEFFETVPSGSLEYALWLESDRLATLPDAVTEERLKNQISVVENERRQRAEIEPYGTAGILVSENLYPANHPYAHSVIGSHDDLRAATVPDVKQFFSTFYSPDNLSMALVGDFDPIAAKQWIAKYFGGIPPAPPPVHPARWTPHLDGEKIVDASDHVAEERLYLAWPGPAFVSPERSRLSLAARMLGRRINGELVYADKPLCTDTSVDLQTREDASTFVVMASARPGTSLAEIEAKLDAAIASFAKDGGTAAELEQARRKTEYDDISRFDTLQSTAETLNEGNLFAGDPAYHEQEWKQMEGVSSADIASAVGAYIGSRNRLLVRFHPDRATAQQTPPLDRGVAPAVHPDPPLQAPTVQTARLANGLEVLVAARPDAPKVTVLLTVRAGLLLDPAGKDGLALLTAATMPMGTASRSGTQVRDDMEAQSATTVGSSVAVAGAGLDFEVLPERLEGAFGVFADVVLHPAFKQYSLETNQRQFGDGLAAANNDPGEIVQRVLPALLYGPTHPYAHPVATREGLQALQREDLHAFYDKYWKPNDSALVFAGKITLDQAVALAQKYLGDWAGQAPDAPAVPPPHDLAAGRIYLIDKPDAAQSVLLQFLPAPGLNSPERFPLSLAVNVWGGMWGSRLSDTLREQNGYTYGIASGIGLDPCCGELHAFGSVETAKTKDAVAELQRQLRLLKDQPITEAEFDRARKANLQQSAAQFETSGGLASRIATLWGWNLPMSALQGETDGVQQTTLAAVRAAVNQYVKPAEASLLVVGDRKRIEAGLRQLAPVDLLNLDGTPARTDNMPRAEDAVFSSPFATPEKAFR